MQESVIRMEGARKSYFLSNGDEVPVLNGIDLNIRKNEFIALMGESGSGKTTLLNIIGCLHPLSSGKYFFEGEDMSDIRNPDAFAFIRNKKMGFIFQQFNLIQKMTALKNVALPMFYADISRSEREERAYELLKSVGLGDRTHHKPSELSGGQQQRVSIARALANSPEIILADEPTGALDSKTGEEIMQIFMSFLEQGKTVIMVTHTPEIGRFASRIISLKDGRVTDPDYKIRS